MGPVFDLHCTSNFNVCILLVHNIIGYCINVLLRSHCKVFMRYYTLLLSVFAINLSLQLCSTIIVAYVLACENQLYYHKLTTMLCAEQQCAVTFRLWRHTYQSAVDWLSCQTVNYRCPRVVHGLA